MEVWPRGGAKSSTAELGCARVCAKLARRFVLYVCETQEQADKHVGSVGNLLESLGVERAVNMYGHSRGWRRQELRTANGFNVSAFGLDTAGRGVKMDQYRPDLILFDDVDNQDDSPKTVEKKIGSITTAIIPAGSADCAYLFLQNMIHEEGIVARLVDGRADFLHDREVPCVEPAVIGLQTETVEREDGATVYRVTAGEATWIGQSLAICEAQINDWGLRSFKREAQHEVQGASGYFFDHTAFRIVECVPEGVKLRLCRAWDLAATQGGGDYTCGVLSGLAPNGVVYVLDVIHEQFGSDRVRSLIKRTAEKDREQYGALMIHLPQDPGQAGVGQAQQYRALLKDFGPKVKIESVSGKKAVRARGWADKVNSGNACLIHADWNWGFTEEHRKFREDEEHEFDDQVDAVSDAFNELSSKRIIRAYM